MNRDSIAIICRQFAFPDGGDPTASYALRLAAALAASRLEPLVCGLRTDDGGHDFMAAKRALRPLGVSVACLFLPTGSEARESLAVLDWLQRLEPALAVFVGCEDIAYWPVLARTTRTGLLATPVVIASVAPMSMTHGVQAEFIDSNALLQMELQRQALASADLVIALNAHAASAVQTRNAVVSACPPVAFLEHPISPSRSSGGAKGRLVLCGDDIMRSERSRDVLASVDALLANWPSHLERRALLVGSTNRSADVASAALVQRLAERGVKAAWLAAANYLDALREGQGEGDVALFLDETPQSFDALVALATAGVLAGVSTASPYASLFAETGVFLFPPSPEGFTEAARRPRPAAAAVVRPALKRAIERAVEQTILALKDAATAAPLKPFQLTGMPKVSVCISHFDRPDLLDQAVRSLEVQTYTEVEVIIVDDASPSPSTRTYLDELEPRLVAAGGRLIRNTEEKWQQESRNIAARAATGKYVLIMDDDNCARPDEILAMAAIAEALDVPIVRCLQNNFSGSDYPEQDPRADTVDFFPTGGPLSLGTMWNVFGDVNVLFDRELFLSMGGFTATEGLGCEDFEIGIRYAMADVPSITIPRVLYDYRLSAVNMAKRMDNKRLYDSHARLAALYERAVPRPLAPVFRLLNERFHRIWQRDGHAYWTRLLPEADSFTGRLTGRHATEAEALLHLAGVLLEEGDPDDALAVTTRLLSWFPEQADILELNARAKAAANA